MEKHLSIYCVLPWKHLATHPHGGVTLCCVSDHTNSKNRARNFNENTVEYLNLNHDSVDAVMNSDYFKEVRLQMLNGEVPDACKRCFAEESNNVRSKRIEENERLQFTEDMARAITKPDGTIPVSFKFIELRLGNLCNVKCRTCNPASSTSWSGEYQKLQTEVTFVTKYDKNIDSSWTEADGFWNDLLAHSKDVELIYVNGGEPTLVEKHWKYLERLIKLGLNKQITLWYNINMTNLPDKLIELWKNFKAVQVTCSIDDLGTRNEYIRTGTKWKDVIENLDKLQSFPWITASVCQTVSWMNAYYLNEFDKFMKDRGLHVHLNFVHDPRFLSVAILPSELEKTILSRLTNLHSWQVNAISSQFNNSGSVEESRKGLEYNNWLDKSRGTEFSEIFPEWNEEIVKVIS